MSTISEADLIDCLQNKAVKKFSIRQTANGTYQIIVSLTWKEGELILETSRKAPREWASLDRLIRHIQEKYGKVPTISLTLHQQE
jgi:hypothetical protein